MDAIVSQGYRPIMSAAQIPCSEAITVYDEYGQAREVDITGERPLALIVDRREIVTLMTLGGKPELLAIGYLLTAIPAQTGKPPISGSQGLLK